MKITRLLIATLFIIGIGAWTVRAQTQPSPCPNETENIMPPDTTCTAASNGTTLTPGSFQAIPLIDGTGTSYGDPDNNIVSLYGGYGNNENNPTYLAAQAHYQHGIALAANIKALCHNGAVPGANGCADGTVKPAIVFLYIGMSNLTLEMGGGSKDDWPMDMKPQDLYGQPCSSECPNFNNPKTPTMSWNQVTGDPMTQYSVLYQVYSPSTYLVGPSVVVWNGAMEGETLPQWDPTSNGYYYGNTKCPTGTDDPVCEYDRVEQSLKNATGNGNTGGYTEAQVQAIFIKAADKFPQCDLNHRYCNAPITLPDAYQMEIYLGDIVRYLKCCEVNGINQGRPRYPNLQQVFVTSRIYGGYANGQLYEPCENPEPFAYEGGFAVQRLIVDQINQVALYPGPVQYDYAGEVDYSVAPWIDWGPYLWASGGNPRNFDGLYWCGGVPQGRCTANNFDVRQGDTTTPLLQIEYPGDYTHPNAFGIQKVGNLLVNFMNEITGSPWVTPWINK